MRPFLAIGLGLTLLILASPTLAEPVCGASPAMERLQADLHQPRGRVMVAAHRGGHLRAPENSLGAIEEAVRAGADIVEIDIKVSSDGVPYLMHDQTVTRTTGGQGDAEALAYDQIRRLRLEGGAEPPPTLIEALRRTCGRVLVDLDLKTDRIAPVMAVVEGLGMADQVIVFDSDSHMLRRARSLLPQVEVMPRVDRPDALQDQIRDLSAVAVVHGDPGSLTPPLRSAIRALPARAWVNALGDVDDALAVDSRDVCARVAGLLALDANIIQTDQPARLRRALTTCRLEAAP